MRLVVGLGSNLGNREGLLRQAVNALLQRAVLKNVRMSSLYETPALLPEGAPLSWDIPFYNIAVSGECSLDPQEVLRTLKEIESALGRKSRERWAPREVDLDILAYGDYRINTPSLQIPHAGLLERAFAVSPFKEIEPTWPLAAQVSVIQPIRDFKLMPALMGVINITPDSFSDGGRFLNADEAARHALELVEAGAEILDLGAESTRPGATPLSWKEEWERLEPVLLNIRSSLSYRTGTRISIDTRHVETAERALELGASILNDVSGFASTKMRDVAARNRNCDVVFMHSLTIPADREVTLPKDSDPVEEVLAWARVCIAELEAVGIAKHRMIFDPGIGFGKTPEQSIALVKNTERLAALGVRLLMGISRKSFFSKFSTIPSSERDTETLAATFLMNRNLDIDILRVHNVEMHARALRTYEALVVS